MAPSSRGFLSSVTSLCAIVASSALLASCGAAEVHLHDRPSLSYPIVRAFAEKHRGTTVVLLDYHHNAGPILEEALSSNWISTLVRDSAVSRVLWVSGRTLLLPNKNARIAWLKRNLASCPPSDASFIESKIVLTDWSELESGRIPGPVAAVLDFDLFCHDPGDPPERFLDEISAWLIKQKPGLVTLEMSALHENDPRAAWARLERFVGEYGHDSAGSRWFLEAGERSPAAEGLEESAAWSLWARNGETFGRRGRAFSPGAGIWIGAPMELRSELLSVGVKPGDPSAEDVISGWCDQDGADLERRFPDAVTDRVLANAAVAIEDHWRGGKPVLPDPGPLPLGIALRLTAAGSDRGCLALYRGVRDAAESAAFCAHAAVADPRYPAVLPSERAGLDLELSVFGPWRRMAGPFDFRPGFDSLMLVDGVKVTLIQAAVAQERGYDRKEFLERLANKAGLEMDGWKKGKLVFKRASTVWSRMSLDGIEALPVYQKYAKK